MLLSMARFANRAAAGSELGRLVADNGAGDAPIVLALPRGGLPVAMPVADAIGADLDVLIVRKLRTPGQDEVALGAVASGGVCWLAPHANRVDPAVLARLEAAERDEVVQREQRYRSGRPQLSLAGRTAVIVDDGIATGSTMHAAVEAARLLHAARVVVAVPIATPRAVELLATVADRVDAVEVRSGFGAVSVLYDDFAQVPDDDAVHLLSSRAQP